MARSRSGLTQVRSHRNTGWEEGPGGTTERQSITSEAGFVGQALSILADGLTLVRTRGLFRAQLEVITAAGDGFQGAFGIGKASLAAIAVGITAVPTPITEQTWEGWLFWHPISVHGGVSAAADSTGSTQEFVVDSKAMRKINSDEGFYAAFEVVELGTAQVNMWFDSRMLFKLP